MRGSSLVEGFISNKVRALFCYLVMNPHPHTRETLAGLLWGDMPENEARANLRKALSNLRKLFPEWFHITRQTVTFDTQSPYTLDVAEFQRLYERLQGQLSPEERPKILQELVSLSRGEFLAGFYVAGASTFNEWAFGWRERFSEQAFQARYALAEHYMAHRLYPQAVTHLRHILSMDPWREDVHRDLMMAYARMGEQKAALKQYAVCKQVLSRELDVLPAPETVLLYERIKARGERPSGNIPRQPVPCFGREKELQIITQRLTSANCRWLTVTGLGGVGKTRLAIDAAQQLSPFFFDGVFFVSLASVHTLQAVVSTIAETLGMLFDEQGDRIEQLVGYLQQRETLLVLDNCEHLTTITPVLEHLLEHTHNLKVLLTSRQRLHSAWEHVLPLQGVQVDSPQDSADVPSPAVHLFRYHARRVRPGFSPSAEEMGTIRQICRTLGGLPLGIELAAAWVGSMTCSQILRAILETPAFLDSTLPARKSQYHGLRAILRYTWIQLTPQEQRCFARLAVFGDSFTAEAAQAIAGLSPTLLGRFVEHGLLHTTILDAPEFPPRYTLHQLWLQFATDRLAEMPAERQDGYHAHRRYYLALLQHATAPFPVPDFNNAYIAWKRALELAPYEEFEACTRTIVAFLVSHNRYDELLEILQSALQRMASQRNPDTTLQARWLRLMGEAYFRLGQLPKSLEYHHQALTVLGMDMPASLPRQALELGREILRQVWHRLRMPRPDAQRKHRYLEGARSYERLGQILFFESVPAVTLLYTSLRGMNLAEKAPPSDVLSRLYGNMILGSGLVPLHTMARFYRRLALEVAQRLDSPSALSWVLEISSIYTCGIGDWAQAEQEAWQAIALANQESDTRRRNECLVMPAHAAHARGDFRRSAELWQQIYLTALQSGDIQAQRWGLSGQAENFLPLGRFEESAAYLQATLELPLKVADIGTDITCYGLLALTRYQQEKFSEARRVADIGLRLVAESSPTAFSSVNGYTCLALVYLLLWKNAPQDAALADAARQSTSALWAFSRIFTLGRPAALLAAGLLAWLSGKQTKAMQLWRRGIASARALQMPYLEASLYNHMAHHLPEGHPEKDTAMAKSQQIFARLQVPAVIRETA